MFWNNNKKSKTNHSNIDWKAGCLFEYIDQDQIIVMIDVMDYEHEHLQNSNKVRATCLKNTSCHGWIRVGENRDFDKNDLKPFMGKLILSNL